MQALSMIDMGAKAPESIAPAKPAEPKGQQFGKVFNDHQRTETQQDSAAQAGPKEKSVKPEAAEHKSAVKADQAAEQPVHKPCAERIGAEKQAACQVEEPPKVQQLVVNLLKELVPGENPEANEDLGSMEEILTQLVEQLDSTELQGALVLAGIDLSALVAELDIPVVEETLATEEDAEPFQQLVGQLAQQLREALASEPANNVEVDSTTVTLPTAELQQPTVKQQVQAQMQGENLAQARQILQGAIDALQSRQAKPVAEVGSLPLAEEIQPLEQGLLSTEEEVAEKIDPRFAGLLKPRLENRLQQPAQSLREQVQGRNARMDSGQLNQTAEVMQQAAETNPEQAKVAEFSEILGANPRQALESLIQQVQGSSQQQGPLQNQGLTGSKLMSGTPMVQLPSGQQVAESQIFDQVITRMSGSFNGESGRMILRLQPAELGSLRLELQVDGDRLRVNLQAQTLQVQEVLERNLPQLRSALAEQGLKIDQFQVDVNQQKNHQNWSDNLAQQQQRGENSQPRWRQDLESEEQIVPLAHLMQNGGGGISLHV